MLFTSWAIRTEKYFPELSEAARDRRTLLRPRKNIFQVRRTLMVSDVFISRLMLHDIHKKLQCCELGLRSVVIVTLDQAWLTYCY
jgi:hypothetical protein